MALKKVEFEPDYEVTPFCLEFISKVSGRNVIFLANEYMLDEFWYKGYFRDIKTEEDDLRVREELRKYYLDKINKVYGFDLSHFEDFNVVNVAREVERLMDFENVRRVNG